MREDHGPGCRKKYLIRDAIQFSSKYFARDWDTIKGTMEIALRFRGVYRRTAEHKWKDYMTLNEKQIVVLAVEYLYQLHFYKNFNF